MWSEFYLSVACTVLVLLIPGYLAMRAIGAKRSMAVCCSPVVSLSLVASLGQFYALVGIPGSAVAVLAPLVVLTGRRVPGIQRHVAPGPDPSDVGVG